MKLFTLTRAASDKDRTLARQLAPKVTALMVRLYGKAALGRPMTDERVLAYALQRGLQALEADPMPGELRVFTPVEVKPLRMEPLTPAPGSSTEHRFAAAQPSFNKGGKV